MNHSDPPSDHRAATGHRTHAEAVAAALSAPYSPGDQTISARPRRAGIESVEIDVRRYAVFRFVIDVTATEAVSLAELLAGRATRPALDHRTWTTLGRDAFETGLTHHSPLSNPAAAHHFLEADPRDVPAMLAQYQQGWDAAADERARAQLPHSVIAPDQPPPQATPVHFVIDRDRDEVAAVLLEPGAVAAQNSYQILSADGSTRTVDAGWVHQQPGATAAQAAGLLLQLTATGYRLEVLSSLPTSTRAPHTSGRHTAHDPHP